MLKTLPLFFFISFLHLTHLKTTTNVDPITASVYYVKTTGKFEITLDKLDEEAAAYGTYTPSYETKGWDFLTISSYAKNDEKYSDEIKNYAMGYLEGVLTYKRIYASYYNLNNFKYYLNNGVMPNSTYEFFQKNLEFVYNMSMERKDTDDYWHEVYNLYMQMRGLHAGYNAKADVDKKIDIVHFQTVISLGDVDEIGYWKKENRPDYSKMTREELLDYVNLRSHCSALIKVKNDLSDVFFGHNTWTAYNKMIRIYKEYKYIANSKFPTKAKTITMSSYPGAVNSQDDFYITDANLYVTETTNHVFDTDLYDLLTPRSLMCWMRTMVANRLTDDGKSWTEVFAKFNSGTYNNQFQILDLKLIDTTRKQILSGALYITEQLPGSCDSEDVTDMLKKGYWPSYNTPFIMDVRIKSGVIDLLEKDPSLKSSYDYDVCARAKIFRRDQSKVTDIDSYKKLIRYNDYLNDEFSENLPNFAIASREDLKENARCYGATDAKFASVNEIKSSEKKIIHIISGPTNDNQKTFVWSEAECKNSDPIRWNIIDQVDRYEFEWIDYEVSLW